MILLPDCGRAPCHIGAAHGKIGIECAGPKGIIVPQKCGRRDDAIHGLHREPDFPIVVGLEPPIDRREGVVGCAAKQVSHGGWTQ